MGPNKAYKPNKPHKPYEPYPPPKKINNKIQ